MLYQSQTKTFLYFSNDIHFCAISNQTSTSNSQPDTHCSAVSLSQENTSNSQPDTYCSAVSLSQDSV